MLLEARVLVLFICNLHSQPRDGHGACRWDCQLQLCHWTSPCGMGWSLKQVGWNEKSVQYLDFFSLETMFNRLEKKQEGKEPGWYLSHCFLLWKRNQQKVIPRTCIKPHSLWNAVRTLSTFSLKTTLLDRNNYYASHCGCKQWDMGELRTWFRIMQTARFECDHQVGVPSAHRPTSNQHVPTGSGLISLPAFLSFFSSCPHALERRWGPHLYNSGLFPPSKEQG